MKELSIEEKAKAYDKAIERAKQHCADYVVETIFPELKESEGEKIRKALIDCLQYMKANYCIPSRYTSKQYDTWIAWLEKQGEQQDVSIQINPSEYINDMGGNGCYLKNTTQKPADKIEPKFKVGDWLVHKNIKRAFCITQIASNYYLTNIGSFINFGQEDNYRPWTIQDAKECDVLVYRGGQWIFIFKEIENNNSIIEYYALLSENGLETKNAASTSLISAILPATKEQCDTLMKAMADAGYEWNAEKKELKKVEQKSAWGEKDERHLNTITSLLEDRKKEQSDWGVEVLNEEIAWLKSIKDRYTWKPSDEQMKALKKACDEHWEPDGLDPLYTLYQDLKKLKE